jgi:hypothetical protein
MHLFMSDSSLIQKRQACILAMVLSVLLATCTSPKGSSSPEAMETEPDPRFFQYYDPRFRTDLPTSDLRTDGLYFRIEDADTFGDQHHIFRFYPDGLLISYQVYTPPDKVVQLDRTTRGNIHGYFGLEGDSLFFTTKVYYNHTPRFFSGKIFRDSLKILGSSSSEEPPSPKTYYFFEEK